MGLKGRSAFARLASRSRILGAHGEGGPAQLHRQPYYAQHIPVHALSGQGS